MPQEQGSPAAQAQGGQLQHSAAGDQAPQGQGRPAGEPRQAGNASPTDQSGPYPLLPVVAPPAPAGPPMSEEGTSAEDAASLVQSPTRQPSSTAASEGWSDEVDTSPETTHILQMLDSSPSQDTIIALHEQQVAAAVREGEMEAELLLAETSSAPSQSDEETDGAAEAVDPSETLDFFHGWWQAHGALLDQVYQQTPNYWLGWHQGREHAQRQAQQEPGSASSSSSSWGVPQAAGWPAPESPASA